MNQTMNKVALEDVPDMVNRSFWKIVDVRAFLFNDKSIIRLNMNNFIPLFIVD